MDLVFILSNDEHCSVLYYTVTQIAKSQGTQAGQLKLSGGLRAFRCTSVN